ncbi:MAG TPA: hypothetical protein VIQ60_14395 [Gemmatimonadaceae bacterium]
MSSISTLGLEIDASTAVFGPGEDPVGKQLQNGTVDDSHALDAAGALSHIVP